MERIIPIDPILEKGYNVRLLVDDFDGLIEKWSNWSEDFQSQMQTHHSTVNMVMARKISLIFLDVENQMHLYLSLFMAVTGKEVTSQSIVL